MFKLDKEVIKYMKESHPSEACGLLVNKSGKLLWFPCDNKAQNTVESFKIAGIDFIKASMIGDVFAVVHSHPQESLEFSEEDIKASEFLKVKYVVVSSISGDELWHSPSKPNSDYIGRQYEEGVSDCWSLVRDYYYNEFNMNLIACNHYSEDWRDNGIPFYNSETIHELGFEEVDYPIEGDIIVFNVMSKKPNHFGIYLDGNIFLHHADNRLSCREPIKGLWAKYLKGFVRCKKFI